MTREDVVRISNAVNNRCLTQTDCSALIIQYCVEQGKPYDKAAQFVVFLFNNGPLLEHCISQALSYYQKKFNICKLYSKPNPMQMGDGRRLILIY